ncbi:high affinity immunoglobulin gamma Fc receptor I-like [Trachinotus anak]|uniref:high affinity immunoglobulin gamma Fc receptor I-like n=1 Tax=Trachinotus anak TaxID=443729 RepID=UPI0039F1818D
MTGSVCKISASRYSDAVYWCESGSGEFSNAVNITVHDDMILMSPVHPVAEGASVTLGCKSRAKNVLSNVFFYKNDKLVQNGTSTELTIPTVSKSHEGFYKCEGKDSVRTSTWASPESWMSVKYDGLMYAQLLFNNKGKPAPAPADKTIYSEVRLGTAHAQ